MFSVATDRQLERVYAEMAERVSAVEAAARDALARELGAEREANRQFEARAADYVAQRAQEDQLANERLRAVLLRSEEFYQGEAAVTAASALRDSAGRTELQAQAAATVSTLNDMS